VETISKDWLAKSTRRHARDEAKGFEDVAVVAEVDPERARAALAARAEWEDDEATAVVIATMDGDEDVTMDMDY